MRKVRVLIVDDSVVVRRILTDTLSAHPQIDVVAAAATGAIALSRLEQLSPDVVTLDVEMPGMNGLDLLSEIRSRHPRLPVIMFSSLTERAAMITLDALARGATDYVTKPTHSNSREEAAEYVRGELVPRLLGLGGLAARGPAPAPVVAAGSRALPRAAPQGIDVLAIGASTGGTTALGTLFGALPPLPIPIVVVLHMPPLFTRLFAERMTATGKTAFREASHGEVLQPGQVYLAPGGVHLAVRRAGIHVTAELHHGPPENSCRPAVDVLFRSVAETYGGRALAVVLTGMGKDGLAGSQLLVERGAQVLVQDEASSVVWGMPGAVAKAGWAELALPLPELAVEIATRVSRQRAAPAPRGNHAHQR